MALNIPPLRERDDDCVVLARHLIDKFSADHGRRRLQLAPDALAAFGAILGPAMSANWRTG